MNKEDKNNRIRQFALAMHNYATAHGKDLSINSAYIAARYLHRLEATLNRLACDQHNKPTYDSEKQDRIEERAVAYVKENIGCNCYTQRDPRGLCIRLYLKDESTGYFFNTWDGETSGCNW